MQGSRRIAPSVGRKPYSWRTCFKHMLWQIVWDMGGELVIPGDALYGPWPKGRMVRVSEWEGNLVIVTEATPADYEERYGDKVEEFTTDDDGPCAARGGREAGAGQPAVKQRDPCAGPSGGH